MEGTYYCSGVTLCRMMAVVMKGVGSGQGIRGWGLGGGGG